MTHLRVPLPVFRLLALTIAIGSSVVAQGSVPAEAQSAALQAPLGAIRGRVLVPEAPVPVVRPAPSELTGSRHPVVDRRRVVVYLESAPRRAFDEIRPGQARMDQRDEQFVPHVLAITVGTSVTFPNNDKTFHNVFSLSRARTFDLGRYRPGRTGRPIRFDRPGIVPVFCDIHTHMSAYILVFSHPFFAVSDTDGRYQIDNVPAGTYSLRVWSELGSAPPRSVVVGDTDAVEANVQVTRDAP